MARAGQLMYEDYKDAAFNHGIVLPHWYQLNDIQKTIWTDMGMGYDNGSSDEEE